MNELMIISGLPKNLAACELEYQGKKCGCLCAGKCVARLDMGEDAQFYGRIWGSGGCFPGLVGGNGAYSPEGPGCTVAYSKSCGCKRPCSEGYTAKRGSGRGSVKFDTEKCGSLSCAYFCTSGLPCLGAEKFHPCFCYSMSTK